MKLSGKVRFIVALVSVVAVVLAGESLPWSKHAASAHIATVHADGGCSLASLNGAYAVSRQGTLLTCVLDLPAPAPWGEVARADSFWRVPCRLAIGAAGFLSFSRRFA